MEIIILSAVAAGLFIIVIILVKFLLYPRKNKKKIMKKMTKEYISRKFDDLVALRVILVINKDSGILIYSYIVEGDDDIRIKSPEFISGALHAIRNIGQEMGFSVSQEFNRLVYGDYNILSNSGKYCQVILISRAPPSSIMEDNIRVLINTIEKKYSLKLSEDTRIIEMSDYQGILPLVRDIFDTFFIEGLNLLYDEEKTNEEVSTLGKLLLNEAAKIYEKKHTVVMKNLFIETYGRNAVNMQEKYSREDVLGELFDLFEKNYFTFFQG